MPVAKVSDLPSPEEAKGPIILNAQIVVAEGKGDVVEKLLIAVQKNALSDAEPGCSEYRVVRSFVKDGITTFGVWEKYENPAAVQHHMQSDAFKALGADKSLFAGPLDIKFFYEV